MGEHTASTGASQGRSLTRRQRRELERSKQIPAVEAEAPDNPASSSGPAAPPGPFSGERPAFPPLHAFADPQAPSGPAPSPPRRSLSAPAPPEAPDSAPPPRRAASASSPRRATSAPSPRRAASAPSPAASEPPAAPREPREPPATTGAQRAIGATLGRPRPRGHAALVLSIMVALAIVLVPVIIVRMIGQSANVAVLAADAPLSSVMEVAGRVGATPVVSLKGRLAPASTVTVDVLVEGGGRELATGDAVLLSVAVFSGTDGANLTGTASGTRIYRGSLSAENLGDTLANAVTGATEGTRVVLRAPVTMNNGQHATEITVVDVLPTIAQGQEVTADPAMPAVSMGEDEQVAISVAGLPVPTRSSAAFLIQGNGAQVTADSTVIARYATVSWADGTVRASTYGATTVPTTINMADTMSGIAEHLVDVPVGSRVVLALPADQARGDEAMVVVIDVLAIADASDLAPASGDPRVAVTPNAAS